MPSPKSTNPAFSSPALASIRGLSFGKVFSHVMEFLYEQCSLHITEKIESSVKLGTRPNISFIRSNSSGSRPRSLAVWVVVRSCCSNFICFLSGCPKLGKRAGMRKEKVKDSDGLET